MKSAGNGGILNGGLQVLHIHVLFVAPLGASYMASVSYTHLDVYKRQGVYRPFLWKNAMRSGL